jgi:hypothetical protein
VEFGETNFLGDNEAMTEDLLLERLISLPADAVVHVIFPECIIYWRNGYHLLSLTDNQVIYVPDLSINT